MVIEANVTSHTIILCQRSIFLLSLLSFCDSVPPSPALLSYRGSIWFYRLQLLNLRVRSTSRQYTGVCKCNTHFGGMQGLFIWATIGIELSFQPMTNILLLIHSVNIKLCPSESWLSIKPNGRMFKKLVNLAVLNAYKYIWNYKNKMYRQVLIW